MYDGIKHTLFQAASPGEAVANLYGLLTWSQRDNSRLKHSFISSGQESSPKKQLEELIEPLIFHSRLVSCWEGVAT